MKKVKLHEVFNVARGGSPRPIQSFLTVDSDGINWIMIGDTEENEKFITRTAKKIRKEGEKKSRRVFPGDFLLTNSMSFGRPYILKIEGCIHDGWLVLSPKTNEISSDFFYYYLGSNAMKESLASKAAGAVVKNLNSEIVRELDILFPPLPFQQKIAEKLDKADALRKKDQELLKYYDELAQSVFIEMFGDPVRNEKGWEILPFGNITKSLNSKRVPLKSSDRDKLESFYPYYGASGIIDYVDNYLFDGENLLIGEDGANLISRSTPIAFIATGKYWVNNHAHVLSFSGKCNLIFLNYFINSIDLTPYITGSAQPKLNKANLDSIPIFVPPLPLQQKFATIIQNIEQQKQKVKLQAEESENLFQALLQESFA